MAESDFGPGGKALWAAFEVSSLTEPHRAILIEACRARDRLDQLDRLLSGEVDVWVRVVDSRYSPDFELKIDDALTKANSTASSLRQLIGMLPAVKGPKARNALDELANRRKDRQPGTPDRVGAEGGHKRR